MKPLCDMTMAEIEAWCNENLKPDAHAKLLCLQIEFDAYESGTRVVTVKYYDGATHHKINPQLTLDDGLGQINPPTTFIKDGAQ